MSGRKDDFKITWRAARVNRGLTQGEVAELTGKNVDTIVKYEKDSSELPKNLEQLWLSLYGVPADLIYFDPESDLTGKKVAG